MAFPAALARLLDREQIIGLIDGYLAALDEGDWDDALSRSLFTENVRLEFPLGTLDGIEGLADEHSAVMAHWDRTLHLSANHRVEVDGDRAHLSGRLVAIHVHPSGAETKPLLVALHALEAVAIRAAEGWRLKRITLRPVWSAGEPPAGLQPTER